MSNPTGSILKAIRITDQGKAFVTDLLLIICCHSDCNIWNNYPQVFMLNFLKSF